MVEKGSELSEIWLVKNFCGNLASYRKVICSFRQLLELLSCKLRVTYMDGIRSSSTYSLFLCYFTKNLNIIYGIVC